MNRLYFFRKRETKRPILQKNATQSLLQGLVILSIWLLSSGNIWSQTAPSISYATPQNYLLNAAITDLAPANSGGSVPTGNYSKTSAFAGSGDNGNSNSVNPLLAEFDAPLGMVQDGNGNIYFTDQYNHRIKKIDGVTGAVTQIAGATTPTPLFTNANGLNDGTGIGNARFDSPAGIDYDGTGALYVADWDNNKIRKIVIASGAVTTVAGGGTGSQSGYTNATGTAARFLSPTDVKYRLESSVPYLYVTDAGNHCIRKINLNTSAVTTYAGTNTSGITEGNMTTARFKNPTSMVFSSTGVLYVVDRGNNKIRKIDSGTVSTVAGSGTNATTEGNGATAAFADPYGITIDGAGNLYVTQALSGSYPTANFGFSTTNASNNYIRKITPSGDVTNFAGTGTRGAADNASRLQATFGSPAQLVFDSSKNIMYVTEWYNDKIRKIDLGGYELPSLPALPVGISFNASTGKFSGTPTVINNGPVSYTITANNYYGSSTATVSITTGTLPVLTTTGASAITATTGTTGGNVTVTGGSVLLEKGICWSTSANPTILDSKLADSSLVTGSFTSKIIGLTPLTTYYARAYATNALGTAYGTQVSFTTLMPSPAISYSTPNQFVINTAITPLQVTNSGGAISSTGSYVTTFAGSGTPGSADGTGTAASFNSPFGIVVAADGNFYVAEYGSQKIRKITPSGEVTTFAGSGIRGSIDGIGTAVSFNNPSGMVIDANGNLYVADAGNNKIRKITPAGLVTTFAGSGTDGSTDGTGNAASFDNPIALAMDRIGNIYVADQNNHKIRRITTEGVVTTFAGGNGTAASIDGVGTSASFFLPRGLVIDAADNIYVAGHDKKIRKITPAGVVSTFAGSGEQGTTDGTGNAASFGNLNGLTIDAIGNLYVTDITYNKIRKITSSGVVTSVAGGNLGSTNGLGTQARFASPLGITIDSATGSLYIADNINNSIRKIAFNSYSITPALPAGLVLNTNGSISGTPTVASPTTTYTITAINAGGSSSFKLSIAVAIAPPAISYTATNQFTVNTAITALEATNTGGAIPSQLKGSVSTLAGNGTQGSANGAGAAATFNTPMGVAIDAASNIYVADFGNNKIRKITPAGLVSTLAGSGGFGAIDAAGTAATFQLPYGVAVDASGNVYVADTVNHRIRKITPSGVVSTFAGSGALGSTDGPGTSASFRSPSALCVDAAGFIYVADTGNNKIRKITPEGAVSTLAGSGTAGATNATGTSASFNTPTGVTVDAAGTIYVVDSSNHKIRKIDSNGVVTTLAGNGSAGFIDGAGALASFRYPTSLSLDAVGNVYVADRSNSIIRIITPSGVVSTAAGSGALGSTDGASSAASFYFPFGVAVDAAGNVFVADTNNNKIRKISNEGYSIAPALPKGLVLNADGSISGTPTVISNATNYVIIATNAAGSSTSSISIAVTSAIPTWTGTEWINGLVAKNAPAIIAGNYSSVGNLEIGELTIKNNASVVFQSGHNLTINGKLTVEAGGTLTLDSNSNLLQTTNVTNSGSITVKRQTAPLKLLDYVLWSSPVSGQLLQSFSPATLSTRFYKYDSNIDKYSTVSIPSASAFEGGDGYLIRMPNDHPSTPTIWTGIFTGIPNNGTLSIPIYGSGYIAIGNPYPSAIDADAFIAGNNISEPLYFWRKTNNAANPSYATYTLAGGVGTANSADQNGLIPDGTIQVGQGFITQLNYTDVVFRNTMRIINNNNQFLRTKKTDKSRIWLNLTNTSGFFSQAMVAYMDGATSGIDAAIDGRYFNDCPTALTSIITNEEFSIQGRSLPFDTSDVVPLGFKTETAGEFSLAIDHTDGLFTAGQKVFLKDSVTNTVNDLSTGTYKFTTEAGVFNSRFAIVYQNTLRIDDADALSNQVMVYKQNDKISIDAGSIIMAGIQVYDLNGRLLFERKNINTNQFVFSIATATDVLLIKITSNDGQVIAKKIIN